MTCPGDVTNAATRNWLAWEGFDAASYTLELTWEERAPITGALVTGYHLAPLEGGKAVDVYRDASWKRLEAAELDALGIIPKVWDAPGVQTPPEITPALLKTTREAAPLPASALAAPPTQQSSLAPLDLDAVLREDAEQAATGEKTPLRYGVRRALPVSLGLRNAEAMPGAWVTSDTGGNIASLRIHAPGAVGLRVLVEVESFPTDGRLYLYNASDPDERYGPFVPQGSWWSPSCFGDTVVLVVEAFDAGSELDLRIPEVSHLYRSLENLPFAKQAGSCNNDVTCFPDWNTAALGVAGIGSIGINGNIWCTGSLIADTDPTTNVPYFVTANHCVNTNSEAGSLEFYWMFQTSTCDGTAPSPNSVPRTTGGADLLVTSSVDSGTDFTLLRMRNAPPEGLVALGYNSATQSVGTEVTCIHHPRGTFKRITFGDLINSGSPSEGGPLVDRAHFHEVLWNDGTTEPGSSGSPLLLRDTQVYIGQLWGGIASCSHPEEPDYFGRFDVSFPLAAAWLTGNAADPDVDGSGTVDSLDLQIVIQVALVRTTNDRADVDGNGLVDARDLQQVVQAILQGGKSP